MYGTTCKSTRSISGPVTRAGAALQWLRDLDRRRQLYLNSIKALQACLPLLIAVSFELLMSGKICVSNDLLLQEMSRQEIHGRDFSLSRLQTCSEEA